MGRDVVSLRIDKKSNMVNDKSNGTIRVAPKAAAERSGKNDFDKKDNNANARVPEDYDEKQDVLGVKSTNHQPEEKIIKADGQKSLDKSSASPAKPASGSAGNETTDADLFESLTPSLENDKQGSHVNYANGDESNDSGVEVLPKPRDLHSSGSAKKSQPYSHLSSSKQMQPHCKLDEEDNWSLASSTATSVRTRVTVPVAPRFNCVNRLERRKEFYTKLEEKHRALEKEKLDYEARNKEEEQAAIKQLRRHMMYKANPVPSFYREGPPPKVELKKLPVTRAKSPNLSRRKSCGDAITSTPEDKVSCGRATRHSVGVYREGSATLQKKASPITPKSKDLTSMRKLNGSNKAKVPRKQSKETSENSQTKEPENADIAVQS